MALVMVIAGVINGNGNNNTEIIKHNLRCKDNDTNANHDDYNTYLSIVMMVNNGNANDNN